MIKKSFLLIIFCCLLTQSIQAQTITKNIYARGLGGLVINATHVACLYAFFLSNTCNNRWITTTQLFPPFLSFILSTIMANSRKAYFNDNHAFFMNQIIEHQNGGVPQPENIRNLENNNRLNALILDHILEKHAQSFYIMLVSSVICTLTAYIENKYIFKFPWSTPPSTAEGLKYGLCTLFSLGLFTGTSLLTSYTH
jgi:hypothetical protein